MENKETYFNSMDTGLTQEDILKIQSVFSQYKNIKEVVLYGSRAVGNYKPASDIDLTLVGDNLDLTQLNEIELQLDDLYLPYKFDVSIFNRIENPDLLNHIERVGKIVYKAG